MNRPFYIYTPRNVYGENLISPWNNCVYSIRNCFEPKKDVLTMGQDYQEAAAKCKEMNDKFEAEQPAIYI